MDSLKLQVHPSRKANFVSKVTLWWIVDLLRQGFRKPLKHEDLHPIRIEEQAKPHKKRLEKLWKNEIKSAQSEQRKPKLWKTMLKFFRWKDYAFLLFSAAANVLGSISTWYCVLRLSIVIGSNFKESSIPRSDYLVYVYGVLLGFIIESMGANLNLRYCAILGIRARAAILGIIYSKVSGVA